MANPIDQFVQLANSVFPAQGPAYVRGDDLPWTHARQQDFAMLSMFLEGRDNMEYFASGTDIVTLFDGEIANTEFGPKRMADDHRRPAGGTMSKMSTPLTEYEWGQEITWHEINIQGDQIFSDSNSQRFYSILKKRNKDFTIDALKKMEKAIGAAPSASMFDDAGTGMLDIKSLWTYCNVWEDQHYVTAEGATAGGIVYENRFPDGTVGSGAPLTTNIQGLNSADFAREDSYGVEYAGGGSALAPTKVLYDGAVTNTAGQSGGGTHMLEQFQYMIDALDWAPIPLAGEFAEGQELGPKAILCTREAKRLFARTNRAHGELFATISPIGNPSQGGTQTYGAMPLMTSDTLRDAALYPDNTGSAAGASARAPLNERTATLSGAYFYFLDPRTVNCWFHSNRGWEQDEWDSMKPINKDVMYRLGRFLGNMHFERFISNGILMPDAATPNYS